MKLVEQGSCLSKVRKALILVAVLSILTASAAVFSRSLKQEGEEKIIKMSFNEDTLPQANIHVRRAPLEIILSSLGKYLKFDVTLDNSAKDLKISADIEKLPANDPLEVRKAIEMILQEKELKAKVKDDHILFIFADTRENIEKYAEMKPWQ